MPEFKKNTSPAMKKKSGFKMKGYTYPGTSPMRNEKETKPKPKDWRGLYTRAKNEGASQAALDKLLNRARAQEGAKQHVENKPDPKKRVAPYATGEKTT